MKKSQIEMMGLVIIIILITIGLLFSVALRKPPEKQTLPSVYSDEKLASDFLITFLETTAGVEDCEKVTFRDLAVDCVRQKISDYHNYNCQGEDSCTFFNNTLKTILKQTLDDWDYEYNLTFIYTFGEDKTILTKFDEKACKGLCEESAPGIQPISLYLVLPGEARLELHIYH